MLQAANTDLFNLLVPKAHKSERQNGRGGISLLVLGLSRHASTRSDKVINPLVPDAHHSQRQDKPLTLQLNHLRYK